MIVKPKKEAIPSVKKEVKRKQNSKREVKRINLKRWNWPLNTPARVSKKFDGRSLLLKSGKALVLPMKKGIVERAESGNIVIRHYDNSKAIYSNLLTSKVSRYQHVDSKTVLGKVNSELALSVVTRNGRYIDPLKLLVPQGIIGTKMPKSELKKLLRKHGATNSQIPTFLCLAEKESGLYTDAIGINSKGRWRSTVDAGLFQINDLNHKLCGISARAQLFNPEKNVACAMKVYKRQGFKAWSTYRYCR